MSATKPSVRRAASACCLVLLFASAAAQQQAPQPRLPSAPDWALIAGWDVYAKKGCGQCHGVRSGSEGRAVRDLYSEGILSMTKPHIVVLSEHVQSICEAQRKMDGADPRDTDDRTASARDQSKLAGQVGVPFEEIVKIAGEERVDVIALGTHGRGRMSRVLMGSVADRVIRLASCPVLTVRETKSEAGR